MSYDDRSGATPDPVEVTLSATDAISGLASIAYRVDSGGWATYGQPFAVAGAGDHVVEYQATDVAGNVSEAATATVRIAQPDTTPPVVTVTTVPGEATGEAGWFTGPVAASLAATDDRSAVTSTEYSLNGGDWTPYTDPIDLPEAVNRVLTRATDARGNVSAPASSTIRRDQTAPVSAASFDDQDGRAQGPVTVELVSNDAGSGVQEIRYSVDGGAEQTYTAPFTVTGNGATITFHAVDVAANVEAEKTATVRLTVPDTTPPDVVVSTSPPAPSGTNGWYAGDVTVSLSATDDRSGVPTLEYRRDGGPWTAYAGPLTPPAGVSTYQVRATDGSGNTAAVQSVSIKRDYVAPTVDAVVSGGAATGRPATVTLTATDDVSGVAAIAYRIDTGPWLNYSGPVSVSGVGDHTVTYSGVDAAGNRSVDACVAVPIGADRTPPAVAVAAHPGAPDGSNGWYVTAPTVGMTTEDPSGLASQQYRTAGAWLAYTTALVAPAGVTTYSFRATDTAKNVSPVVVTKVKYDDSAPVTTATFDDHGGTGNGPVPVTLRATDTYSGPGSIAYEVDGQGWTPYQGVISVRGAGTHVVRFAATDLAGNTEPVKQASVRIAPEDTTAPSLTVTTSPAAPDGSSGWFSSAVSLTAAATDVSGIASIQYRLNSGSWRFYKTAVALPVGVTTIEVKAIDKRGNVSLVQTRQVQRDVAAPVAKATFNDQSGTTTGPVPLTLSATDPVSGVSRIVYSLDGGPDQVYQGVFVVTGSGRHTVTYRATDVAGNVSVAKSATVRIR